MRILFLLCLTLVLPSSAYALTKITAYANYGIEEKYDVFPGLVDKPIYFGGIINFNEKWELQLLLSTGSELTNNTHVSANYHYLHSFVKEFGAFFNIGPGIATAQDDTIHLNFDVGLKLKMDKFRVRVFHKSQNHFWGVSQYALSVFFFSLGYQFQ